MPQYLVKCKACKKIEEVTMTWKEREELLKEPCPECGAFKRFNLIKNVNFQMTREFKKGLA